MHGWVRKGYTFDGCLHWLTGSAPTGPLYAVWQELGELKDHKITNHEAFFHVVTPSGRRLLQWGNLDRLFEELKGIGPEDATLLEQLKADGSEHRGDMVISAADGHATLFGMLNDRYVPRSLKKLCKTLPLYKPLMQVSFGVKRDLSAEPRLTTYGFSPAVRFGGTEVPFILLNNYGFDPTMAPAGCSALTLLFWSPFDYWEKLHQDRDRYREEKKRVAEDATRWLESIYPGIRGDIEVLDVSTPMTTLHYTGNWCASYEG